MTTLRLAPGVEVGAATHTGHVRSDNEDDYIILSLPEQDLLLLAVADGMGGLAGGRDASRAAVRALGTTCAARVADRDGAAVLRAGFEAATAQPAAIAQNNQRLADLGTTLTACLLRGDGSFLGHVGDSRCLRVRRSVVEQLSEDHALEEPRHMLTRCLGAGQSGADGDFLALELRAEDVLVLCTDGAWSVLVPEEIAAAFRSRSLQTACETLLRTVLSRGAPDNATIVAVRRDPAAQGAVRNIDLKEGEIRPPLDATAAGNLRRPLWPWLLLALALLVAIFAWLRGRHGFGLLGSLLVGWGVR